MLAQRHARQVFIHMIFLIAAGVMPADAHASSVASETAEGSQVEAGTGALAALERTDVKKFGGATYQATLSPDGADAGVIFADDFETPQFIEPPLRGDLRLGSERYASPAPAGAQLETLSSGVRNGTSLRYLQASTDLVGQVAPRPQVYTARVDFERFDGSPGGEVEATMTAVDLSLGEPSASTSGCQPSDFDAFPDGHIALIQAGNCSFAQQAANAEDAGAVGVVILNQGTPADTDLFIGSLGDNYRGTAPVVSVGFALGQEWAEDTGATFRIRVDEGQRTNAWVFKPVVHPDAGPNTYWLRNSVTGEVLYPGERVTIGFQPVDRVELGDLPAGDARAWWTIESPGNLGATLIRNVAENDYLSVINSRGSAFLFSTSQRVLDVVICPSDPTCNQWRLDRQFRTPFSAPPSGSTRIRTALGEEYLHVADDTAKATLGLPGPDRPLVDRVKPGWPKAQWILEPVPNTGFRRLLNVLTGEYLHVEFGLLEAGDIEPGWHSAMWTLEPAADIGEINGPAPFESAPSPSSMPAGENHFRLRNRWTGELLIVDQGFAVAGSSAPDALGALWVLDDETIPAVADATLEAELRSILDLAPSVPILSSEAAGVYFLDLPDAGISSLDGIENYPNLRELRLAGNAIVDTGPLRTLEELELVDLSRNPQVSIAGLEQNTGLGAGDRVLLLQTEIGRRPPPESELLFSRGVAVVPGAGLMALHDEATGELAEFRGGDAEFVLPNAVTKGGNWSVEYDIDSDAYYLRNEVGLDGRPGYLAWNRQDNNLFFDDREGSNPQWLFEPQVLNPGPGVFPQRYRIRNDLAGEPLLQKCGDDLDINSDQSGCIAPTFYIDGAVLQAARDRAFANYYDPQFAPPLDGFTRIQHTDSREFLRNNGGTLELARPGENWLSAQWELIPIRFDRKYYYAARNRSDSSQYLYRADGELRVGALPAGSAPPDGPEWAVTPANRPYLFDFDGSDTYAVRPLNAADTVLEANENTDEFPFISGFAPDTLWRLDGGLPVPPPPPEAPVSGNFVQLQNASKVIVEFSANWLERGPDNVYRREFRTGSGVFTMPSDSLDIRVRAECVGCEFLFVSDSTIFDLQFDQPPNECIEARGTGFNLHYGGCDPTEGNLAAFARGAAAAVGCEIGVLGGFIPSALSQLGVQDVVASLLAGDLAAAEESLFNQGDLRGPDFSSCSPYKSMTFGAGGSAGIAGINAGGEVGVVWGLNDDNAGADSYTSVSVDAGGGLGLVSLEGSAALGIWKGDPAQVGDGSRALGVELFGADRKINVALRKLKKLKKVGISGALTLWFGCDTGTGPVVISEVCVLRKDSKFLGFTFDFGVSPDFNLPLGSDGLPFTLTETCVPGNFDGGACRE